MVGWSAVNIIYHSVQPLGWKILGVGWGLSIGIWIQPSTGFGNRQNKTFFGSLSAPNRKKSLNYI